MSQIAMGNALSHSPQNRKVNDQFMVERYQQLKLQTFYVLRHSFMEHGFFNCTLLSLITLMFSYEIIIFVSQPVMV